MQAPVADGGRAIDGDSVWMHHVPPTTAELDRLLTLALAEDVGSGDHTSLATLPPRPSASANCLVKGQGVLAGLQVFGRVFALLDAETQVEFLAHDGDRVQPGQVVARVTGKLQVLLSGERLALNLLQRMSGVATQTARVVEQLQGTGCGVLDTRKTTPLLRSLEKWAVQLGGGTNHRFGLWDMILIKDNHIDLAGGVVPALQRANTYVETHARSTGQRLPIVVECRSLNDVQAVLALPPLHWPARLLLDNFDPPRLREAVQWIDGRVPTEASGGITPENARSMAETGVNFVSMGALTHSAPALDISLKVSINPLAK